eukprot:scaffold51031_cov63-Attheya_sp.AAC.2
MEHGYQHSTYNMNVKPCQSNHYLDQNDFGRSHWDEQLTYSSQERMRNDYAQPGSPFIPRSR